MVVEKVGNLVYSAESLVDSTVSTKADMWDDSRVDYLAVLLDLSLDEVLSSMMVGP
jgi:hypothetical protein